MEHTKDTWEISKHATPDYAPQYGIHDGGRNDFCIVKGENAEAVAKHIIQCVNERDELMGALRKYGKHLSGCPYYHPIMPTSEIKCTCGLGRVKNALI